MNDRGPVLDTGACVIGDPEASEFRAHERANRVPGACRQPHGLFRRNHDASSVGVDGECACDGVDELIPSVTVLGKVASRSERLNTDDQWLGWPKTLWANELLPAG